MPDPAAMMGRTLALLLGFAGVLCASAPQLPGAQSKSTQDCLPVQYDVLEHSTWTPYLSDRIINYTMYQQFCVVNSTSNFTANFTQSWSREPFNLSHSEDHYHIHNPLHPYVSKDGHVCVNASITLYNISSHQEITYANGNYDITVLAISTGCTPQSSVTFRLTISECSSEDVPTPMNPTPKKQLVTNPTILHMSFKFLGDNQILDYRFHLTKNNRTYCDETGPPVQRFTCFRHTVGQCNVTFYVDIHNYTRRDLGMYCAAAYSTGSPDIGNKSCMELDMRQSESWGKPVAISLGVGVPVSVCVIGGIVARVVYKKKQKRGKDTVTQLPPAGETHYGATEPLLTPGGYQSNYT